MTWVNSIDDEVPLFEPIRTNTDQRREVKKLIAARLRKGHCAKNPYSRKQALTARAFHLSRGEAQFLKIYRCPRCPFWHLSHKRDRRPRV